MRHLLADVKNPLGFRQRGKKIKQDDEAGFQKPCGEAGGGGAREKLVTNFECELMNVAC